MDTQNKMANEKVFLVLATVIVSEDGGHTTIRPLQYWVKAINKQAAARNTTLYLRAYFKQRWVSDSILRVLSEDDWGKAYFPMLSDYTLDE